MIFFTQNVFSYILISRKFLININVFERKTIINLQSFYKRIALNNQNTTLKKLLIKYIQTIFRFGNIFIFYILEEF